MKTQAQFTAFTLETWLAALSVFPAECVKQAIVEIAMSADPFPDCAKIALRADEIRRIRDGVPSQGERKLGSASIKRVAEAMGIGW